MVGLTVPATLLAQTDEVIERSGMSAHDVVDGARRHRSAERAIGKIRHGGPTVVVATITNRYRIGEMILLKSSGDSAGKDSNKDDTAYRVAELHRDGNSIAPYFTQCRRGDLAR